MTALKCLEKEVTGCMLCPRLVAYRTRVATEKRKAYLDWEYWGRPVPGFGDPQARLLIVGLAPGAHGANRTGRVFTGDSSGDFLYPVLYETGFASQPWARSTGDGLRLRDAYIGLSARCVPPNNKPKPHEIRNCRQYLDRELDILKDLRVVVALGKIAFENYLALRHERGEVGRQGRAFGHGVEHDLGPGQPILIASYHPSRQNTQTGKLTKAMFLSIFARARTILGDPR